MFEPFFEVSAPFRAPKSALHSGKPHFKILNIREPRAANKQHQGTVNRHEGQQIIIFEKEKKIEVRSYPFTFIALTIL
jgi:hypothetical protein